MSAEPTISVTVAVVGKFNPAIVQPAWLASERLITKPEADDAVIEIIHPDVSAFSIRSAESATLRVQVFRERFDIRTEDARLFESVRDLSIGILSLLRHTPVSGLGINVDAHVDMKTEAARDELGRRLAPPSAWGDALPGPVMTSLSMKGQRADGRGGSIVVRVEPSLRLLPVGVFIAVNDHFDVAGADGPGTDGIVDLLKTVWDASLKRSREIITKVGR